ncbi:unnamed protein product [Mycena citricolor]|uniref:SPX domain-containing protein n=1 Tax=Mycena citricolor TaxID=2018698 RepID=A0AAD2HGU7_9AGAR|nr:unnamed protein product [Mycena citricolor]
MKFTRYIEDTQVPEWTRAYLDYRIFKDRIRDIRSAQESNHAFPGIESPSNSPIGGWAQQSDHSVLSFVDSAGNSSYGGSEIHLPLDRRLGDLASNTGSPQPQRARAVDSVSPPPNAAAGRLHLQVDSPMPPFVPRSPTSQTNRDALPPSPGGAIQFPATTAQRAVSPRILLPQLVVRQATNRSHHAPPSPLGDGSTMHGRMDTKRLGADMMSRVLTNHSQARKGDTAPSSPVVSPSTVGSRLRKGISHLMDPLRRDPYSELSLNVLMPLLSPQELAFFTALDSELQKVDNFFIEKERAMKVRAKDLGAQLRALNQHRKLSVDKNSDAPRSWPAFWRGSISALLKLVGRQSLSKMHGHVHDDDGAREAKTEVKTFETSRARDDQRDPKAYPQAKRKWKKAILEHYRGLEMLQNYRILNIYAFRRVLIKFEKATKISVQRAYMEGKVELAAFYSDDNLRAMMQEDENLYAINFGKVLKTHHKSTFQSGLALGAAMIAVAAGIFDSFQPNTRAAIPGWDGLMFIYGVLAIPAIFALLVGLNLLVWAHSRINYVFIFELDLRTRLDHREYFQTPAILLTALCYAFWLSFSRILDAHVAPATWPLVWLAFTGIVMFDPFPLLYRPSRYWLVKSTANLLKSGLKRVEVPWFLFRMMLPTDATQFTDFWMGDQFTSLEFTLSNIPLVSCVYARSLDADWRKCGSTSKLWPLSFVIAVLPFVIRMVQSIKRYADSKLTTHLINAGKYWSGIISYLCYFLWRHKGSKYDLSFAFWCLFQSLYSSYALTWDFLMDWSIFRRHSRHWLLRNELIYSNHVPLYYTAIVSFPAPLPS